ncbi:MAG TPA: acetone carboxylase [Marmoricola sp.]|nr:acetone carboxylase [Marmoricola sp.]HNN47416.1 acetone carboxylase [Marmoricola sp.]HNO39203.1 acetone carboxylase [Marmoricola sp.]
MNEMPCSAKGCENPAVIELRWNNPKLHKPRRRKVWLACAEHRDSLGDFLGARNFLREIVPVGTPMPEGADDR